MQPPTKMRLSPPRWAALLALILAAALMLTTVPGVFTIDEPNYLASLVGLRHGRLSLPWTENLPPSQELAFFDPTSRNHGVRVPVASYAPPLYAWIALPFSLLGFRGLFALNILAFALITWMVWHYTRLHSERAATPWAAAAIFAFATYSLEYSQAVWPHMLATALTTGSWVLASSARRAGALLPALAAGLLVGLAAGVRYQNAFLGCCIGLVVLLFSTRRWRASIAFGLGFSVPLALSSWLNHARFGSWNPISKGPAYFELTAGESSGNFLTDSLLAFWVRVVDYSARPPGRFHTFVMSPSPDSGAFVFLGVVKKALLQSLPWAAVALLALALAWRMAGGGDQRSKFRELRAISLVVWPILLLFSAAGLKRTDGLCFNQRYFLELLPLLAVALAWTVERYSIRRRPLLIGLLGAALAAYWALELPPSKAIQELSILYVPLALAGLLIVGWLVAVRGRATGLLSLALGAALLWASMVHLGHDVAGARDTRATTAAWMHQLERVLPERAAVIVWGSVRNFVAPLQLERDLIILDALRDQGQDAPRLARILLQRGWRVIVVATPFPVSTLETLLAITPVRGMETEDFVLFELGAAEP